MDNLIFHYQLVLHNIKDSAYLHEAFSTRDGTLYSINPTPVEDTDEIDVNSAMEKDSTKYRPVQASKVAKQMQKWNEEFAAVIPKYEDEEDLDEEYYKEDGEVLDVCEFMDRHK